MKLGNKRKLQVCCGMKHDGSMGLCMDRCRAPKVPLNEIPPEFHRRTLKSCEKWMAKQNAKPRFRSRDDLARAVEEHPLQPKIALLTEDPSVIEQAEAVENAIGMQMAMDFSDI